MCPVNDPLTDKTSKSMALGKPLDRISIEIHLMPAQTSTHPSHMIK